MQNINKIKKTLELAKEGYKKYPYDEVVRHYYSGIKDALEWMFGTDEEELIQEKDIKDYIAKPGPFVWEEF